MVRNLTRRRVLVLLLVAIGLVTAGCGEVGSGDLVTEDRPVDRFDSLDISGGINVELVVDENTTPSVSVTYDDNLLDNIVTRVSGDKLVIEFEGNVTSLGGGGRVVKVTVGSLDRIEVSGGSDLHGSGTATGYRLSASGGADVDLSQLEVLDVEVDVSGGADVRVFATDSVEGDASGGADVRVLGRPDRVQIDSSGSADVEIDE